MCQPNNCVMVLQRLRGGWQVCKMQIPKPLKRNSNRVQLISQHLCCARPQEDSQEIVSSSEQLRCNLGALQSFVHCSNVVGYRRSLRPSPQLPRRGCLYQQEGTQVTALGQCPKALEGLLSAHRSLGSRKPRGRGADQQVPVRVLRHTHTRLGKPEPSSSACQQTWLHLSTSCCNYPAAAAPKHLSETVGTTHTPS